MNNRRTMKVIAERSGIGEGNCRAIVKSYEKYCEWNITRFSRKHLSAIILFVEEDTLIEEETCGVVLKTMFDVLAEGMKSKLSFVK